MPLALKPISESAVPRAMDKADRYRLLNEPGAAVSICLDVLAVYPKEQRALVTLLLALTDQFGRGIEISDARPAELIGRLINGYERAYYAGVVAERQGRAVLRQAEQSTPNAARDLLEQAMRSFEAAAEIRPAGNDDAILRWNTCARMINSGRV